MALPLAFLSINSCSEDGQVNADKSIIEHTTDNRVSGCSPLDYGQCVDKTYTGTLIYQGCPISYNVTYQVCPTRGVIVDEPVWSFGSKLIPACKTLKKNLTQAYVVSEGNGKGADLINALVISLSLDAAGKILDLEKNVASGWFACGSGQMSNTLTRKSINCVRYCPNWELDDEGNKILSSITYEACGVACCYKYRSFCYDYSTTPVTINFGATETSTYDGGCRPYNSTCPGTNFFTCVPPCNRL